MKTKMHFRASLLAILTLVTTPSHVPAQTGTVTISAGEFQCMVYSAHLLTQLDEKPELDASLQVLLELHRRNPNANPVLLAGMLREATARYRTNGPSYIRTGGPRDEVLAAYLDALRQVPARTNLFPANLSLLNILVTRAQAPPFEPQADMIHSGSQGLLGSEGNLAQRQALLDACIGRAQGHAGFRAAMDTLLLPETLVSMSDSPTQIISNTNSPLHDNPTMQTLLALSGASGDSSLTVSSNQLMTLFTNETQAFWEVIDTNLSLQLEINESQADLLSYLTNQPAIDADAQRLAAVKQGQPRRLASATAAVLVQSKLMAARDPLIKLPGQMQGCVEGLHKITDGLAAFASKDATRLGKIAASGNILAGGLEVFNLFFGGESPEEEIAREIGNIKTLLGDLSQNVNYRFDRVDQSLTQIYDTLNERFDQIEITLDAQGRQIAHLNGDVDQIRLSLLDVQTDLFRIERNLATFHALDWRFDLLEDLNYVRGFEARAGHPMPYSDNAPSDFLSYENTFYTHAYNRAASETLARYTTLPFGDEYFYSQLSPAGATNVYAETLNYIKKCLRQRLLLAGFPEQPILANPQDWSAGASAWLQMAVENPGHFRRYERDVGFPSRLDAIISKGRVLTNFLRGLIFTGTNINWSPHNALLANYSGILTSFVSQVHATEQQYGTLNYFPVETWRNWSAAAPRVVATSTAVRAVDSYIPVVSLPNPITKLAAGFHHCLAVRADGAIVAWGANSFGETTVPTTATNVVAIAAGFHHSVALRANGTVVCWGSNNYGERDVPAGLSNVSAIAVSGAGSHNLALLTNGTVVAWGDNQSGQTNVPIGLSDVVLIAAGPSHSLALRADRTVVGWGYNSSGQATPPARATNVVALAAGWWHSVALRADGSVVCWGADSGGLTNVPSAASNVVAIAAGMYHSVALRADGTVVCWGNNSSGVVNYPAGLNNIETVAAGAYFNLALKRGGNIVAWGENTSGQLIIPSLLSQQRTIASKGMPWILRADGTVAGWTPGLPGVLIPPNVVNAVAIAEWGRLAVKADGGVVWWGDNEFGQGNIPPAANNVIDVATGTYHCLALRKDGTVVGWGQNRNGQLTIPAGLNNVVAIAADGEYNLALKANGTVVAWGYNQYGALNIPGGLNNVVAISASWHALALKADGTVVGWGHNSYGQCNPPASLTNAVAISANSSGYSVALRADDTIVAWGWNGQGQTNTPPYATDVAAIGTDRAVRADGTIVYWSEMASYDWGRSRTDLSVLEHIFDATTNRLPMTHRGAARLPTDSPLPGYALSFNGIDNYVTTPNLAGALAGNTVTVELWFRALAAGVLLSERDQTGNWHDSQIELVTTATNQAFAEVRLRVWPLGAPGLRAGAVPYGTWNHIALRYNHAARTLDCFLNGQAGPATDVTREAPATLFYSVGKGDSTALGTGAYFSGQADEFRIWNVARSEAEIQANMSLALSGNEPGLAACWHFDEAPQPPTNVIQVAAGFMHSLVLRADSTVVAFGDNQYGQCDVPNGLSNVVAVSAGSYHSLALRADGTVTCWGRNFAGESTSPVGLNNVVAIAGGHFFSLALRADGTVVGWGRSSEGAINIPSSARDVVAIAAGEPTDDSIGYFYGYSLALKADGTVVGWGRGGYDQTNVPPGLDRVVAIAAGGRHSLALRTNGQVVAWGANDYGQANVPLEARSGVVAIAAGQYHSLALKQDGTVVTWGGQGSGRLTLPTGLSNVVAITAGGWRSHYLTAEPAPAVNVAHARLWARADIPHFVAGRLRDASAYVRDELELGGNLNTRAVQLSGAKALLQAVLELGLPYTMQRDDVLHGFLYGSEALTDIEVAQGLFLSDSINLATVPVARPLMLEEVVYPRLARFQSRLSERLHEIQAAGQPELPRMIEHTLRLLNLLRDAWPSVPPPALEIGRVTNAVGVLLYGEPYGRYTLQYRDNLSVPGWTPTTITNLHNEEFVTLPASGPHRFYRAMLPVP